MLQEMQTLEDKEARLASMLPPGPPPPSKLSMGGTQRGHHHAKVKQKNQIKHQTATIAPEKAEKEEASKAPIGNNNVDDEHQENISKSTTGIVSPVRSPAGQQSPPAFRLSFQAPADTDGASEA